MCRTAFESGDCPSVKLTWDGHIEGMLDRDQRTAKTRNTFTETSYVQCSNYAKSYCGEEISDRLWTFSKNCTNTTGSNKRTFHPKSLQRLRQVLVVSLYLLSVVNFPTSTSAPVQMSEMKEEFWINPCNYKDIPSSTGGAEPSNNYDLKGILNQSNTAIVRVQQFLNEYQGSLSFQPDNFQSMEHKWFTTNKVNILSEEQLMELEPKEFVADAYQILQKYAVVFELVLSKVDGFESNFTDTKHILNLLLCEIQEYMYSNKITQLPDIHRTDIDEGLLAKNAAARMVREWITLRDYTTTLRKIDAVFRHMQTTTSS